MTSKVTVSGQGQTGQENHIVSVRQYLEQSPRKCTRRLSQEKDLSRSSVICIMHQDLHLFPYKIHILQLQTNANKVERRAFVRTMSQRIKDHPYFLDFNFVSDEPNFHLVVT